MDTDSPQLTTDSHLPLQKPLTMEKPTLHPDSRRHWIGPFLFLNVLMFLVFSNIAIFYLYPIYLQAIGSSKTTIGWVMGLMPISTVVSRP
ncbi:MAG: MFS transporter, partial [Deltaproteobacteria bacterium]|nr:MFS transporter [Deltaproteobacteria bacterium]